MNTGPSGKVQLMYVVGVVILIGIIAGILIIFQSQKNQNANINTAAGANANASGSVNSNGSGVPLPSDDDRDGLPNTEEQQLGTNLKKADTDSDGLIDFDEVKVYKSDPNKADTNSNGIMDGQEVKNGNNPVDGSKLLDLEKAKKKFSQ